MRRVKFIKVCVLIVVPLVLLATLLVFVARVSPYKLYIVHNGSMSPTIPSGSAIIVWKGVYQLGQVIAFTENGQIVTHRLISINVQGLTTTKGDANATDDPWHVPKKQIIGGVVMAPRYLGYVITFVNSPFGLGSIFLVILVIMMIWKFAMSPPSESELDGQHARRRSRNSAPENLADQPDGIMAGTPSVDLVGVEVTQAEPARDIVTHDERRSDLAVTLVDEAEQPPVPDRDDGLAPRVGHEHSEESPANEPVEQVEPELTVASDAIEQSSAQPDLTLVDEAEQPPVPDRDDSLAPRVGYEHSEESPANEPVEVHGAQPAVLLFDEVEMTTHFEHNNFPSPQMKPEPPELTVPTRPVEGVAIEPVAIHVDDKKTKERAKVQEVDVEDIRRARMAKLFGVVQKEH